MADHMDLWKRVSVPPPQDWDLLSPQARGSLPALLPPAGLGSNFTTPESRGPTLVIVGGILTALMLFFWSSRFFSKRKHFNLKWDDWTCTGAVVLAMACYGNQVWAVTDGATGKHQWDVTIATFAKDSLVIAEGIIAFILFCPTFFLTKTTLFIMYYDIFHVLRWMRVAVLIGFALHAITSVAALATMIALVVPRPGETPFTHFFTWRSQAAQTYASLAFGSTGFVVDLYLFALPLFAVGKTQMTGRRKLAVMLAFMTGLLACAASLLSLYYRVLFTTVSTDKTLMVWNLMITTLVEIQVGIIVSCFPSFVKLLRHHSARFESLSSSARSRLQSLRAKLQRSDASGSALSLPEKAAAPAPAADRSWVRSKIDRACAVYLQFAPWSVVSTDAHSETASSFDAESGWSGAPLKGLDGAWLDERKVVRTSIGAGWPGVGAQPERIVLVREISQESEDWPLGRDSERNAQVRKSANDSNRSQRTDRT